MRLSSSVGVWRTPRRSRCRRWSSIAPRRLSKLWRSHCWSVWRCCCRCCACWISVGCRNEPANEGNIRNLCTKKVAVNKFLEFRGPEKKARLQKPPRGTFWDFIGQAATLLIKSLKRIRKEEKGENETGERISLHYCVFLVSGRHPIIDRPSVSFSIVSLRTHTDISEREKTSPIVLPLLSRPSYLPSKLVMTKAKQSASFFSLDRGIESCCFVTSQSISKALYVTRALIRNPALSINRYSSC